MAVCDRLSDGFEAVAKDLAIPQVQEYGCQSVERDDLDAVFIGTWATMHREMSITELEDRKHGCCQARMCMDL